MVFKILSMEGGGILAIKFIIALLKISKELDKRKIDLLNHFNVFSGVSSGAIITSVLALRENILKNIVINDLAMFNDILRESGYNEKDWNRIRESSKMGERNCSTLILNFLIYFFRHKSKEIFIKNTDNANLINPKYGNNKINVLKKYINYDLKDIPKNRFLLIKSFNLQEMKIDAFTNYKFKPNKYSTNVAELIDWSSNAPIYFSNNGVHVDGGNFINSSYYSEQNLFANQKMIIFSVGSKVSKLRIPLSDEYKWVNKIINIFYNFGKQLDHFTNDTYYHLPVDLQHYQLDDIELIPNIIEDTKNVNIDNALLFINKNIINNCRCKNKK